GGLRPARVLPRPALGTVGAAPPPSAEEEVTRERTVLDDYADEQEDLRALLVSLDDADWSRPTPAAGWDVRDQVSHLADTEEAAHDTMTDGTRSLSREVAGFADGDAWTEAGCEKGRALDATAVLGWWGGARRRTLAGCRALG